MQNNIKCKEHGEPVNAICTTCSSLMCFKCLNPHAKKGCKYPMDIFTYTKEQVIPKFKGQLDNFDKKKESIETSIKVFIGTSDEIRQSLIELKKRIEELTVSINNSVEALRIDINKLLYCSDIKQFLTEEYKGLEIAVEREDAEYIIKRFNYVRAVNMFELGENEKKLFKAANDSIAFMLKSKEMYVLNQSLHELTSIYGNAYAPKVLGNNVYGVCAPQDTYTKLCKYDIANKKLTPCIDIPSHSTVTQFDKRIFISGGFKPLINNLSEFLENSQGLVPKEPMKCAKYAHKTVAISSGSFVTIGGATGTISIAYCEEYSIRENSWRMIPLLNKARCNASAVLMNSRYIYAIGGTGTNSEIEMLSIADMKEWVMIELKLNELKLDDSPEAFPISKDDIMILRGANSTDAGIYNTREKTIKKCSNSLKKDWYFYNPACTIENCSYVIGSRGHVHIYNIVEKSFEEIDYSVAYS